jgi:hypothetical protein
VRGRRNERGKEKKNVKKKGKGEKGVYLPLRRIIYVVSLYCVTEGARDVHDLPKKHIHTFFLFFR